LQQELLLWLRTAVAPDPTRAGEQRKTEESDGNWFFLFFLFELNCFQQNVRGKVLPPWIQINENNTVNLYGPSILSVTGKQNNSKLGLYFYNCLDFAQVGSKRSTGLAQC